MNNISIGLVREMNHIHANGCTTGKYNTDDLVRISEQTWSIIDYISQLDYEHRAPYQSLLSTCGWIILLCQTIDKVINDENK